MSISARSVAMIWLALTAGTAAGTPIANPSTAALADDLNGSGYFTPGGSFFGVEIFDVGDFLGIQPITFGFYFASSDVSNPANLIPIFEADDLVNEQAVVNFGSGIVVDVDQAAIQGVFSGLGDIGFYATLNAFGGTNLYSDPLLNSGTDYFGAFPFLVDPSRLALAFYDSSSDSLISLIVANGLTPVTTTVPEPSTFLLMAASLLWLTGFRRRRVTTAGKAGLLSL